MTSQNGVKSNCDVIANFSLIFPNSEFLMKIKFASNSGILPLFNNTKISVLRNSGI